MRPASLALCALVSLLTACDDGDDGTGGPGGASSSATTSTTAGAMTTSTGTTSSQSSGVGGAATGDRVVAPDGTDAGDCSVDACKTFAYAASKMSAGETLLLRDGTYPDAISEALFPRGATGSPTRVVAEHDGAATITGTLSMYEQGAAFFQEFVGVRFVGPATKAVTGSQLAFRRVSFVGGPDSGNAASLAVGTNDFYPGAKDMLFEDCLFYGQGGRYAALVYRTEDVVFRRAVLRKDGGWGLGGPASTEYEPEGVINFYESAGATCDHCVVLDSLKESDGSAEALGAFLSVSNGAPSSTNSLFTSCASVNNAFKGFAFEGNAAVTGAQVVDSFSAGNSFGIVGNVKVASDVALVRVGVFGNTGDGVASYGSETITLADSKISGNDPDLDGVSGGAAGAGPAALDLSALDSARIRKELCDGVTRGLCATQASFADYVASLTTP